MKTKEEILAQKTDWVSEQPFSKLKANVLEAMQLYSDQQNAHWKGISDGKQIIINNLEKQNKELREEIWEAER